MQRTSIRSPATKTEYVYDVEISWTEVKNADHYILEISSQADFQSLLTEVKIRSARTWKWEGVADGTYYMRVAGGTDSGVKGRFSSVKKIVLSPQTIDYQPVGIVVTPRAVPADVNAIATVNPTAEPATKAPTPPPSPMAVAPLTTRPTSPTHVATPTESATSPGRRFPEKRVSLMLGLGYEWSRQKRPADTEVNTGGLTSIQLDIQTIMPINEDRRLEYQFLYGMSYWIPENATRLPYQNNLRHEDYRNIVLFTSTALPYAFGASFNYLSVVNRTGPESIGRNLESFFGLAGRYTFLETESLQTYSLVSLSAGDGNWDLFWRNALLFAPPMWSPVSLRLQFDLILQSQGTYFFRPAFTVGIAF